MRRLLWGVVLAVGAAPALAGQGSTGELLGQAHEFYERLEVERALPLLRQIVSPNWPFEVTPEQRVDAYKYLGACLALAGKRDSAVLYFRAAIERDPFTDLDPSRFTPPSWRRLAKPGGALSPSPFAPSSPPESTRARPALPSPWSPPMPRS